jgi:hypothetical protein
MNTCFSPEFSMSTRTRQSRRSWPMRAGVLLALAIGTTSALADPGFRHKYLMRGQVLEQQESTLVVCIGSADGAEIGQELDVVRHVRISLGPKATGPSFRPEDVGRARITNIFDEHYAQATVLEGEAKVGDVVQLDRPGQ